MICPPPFRADRRVERGICWEAAGLGSRDAMVMVQNAPSESEARWKLQRDSWK